MHTSYSSKVMFLGFPVLVVLFSFAIAYTSERLFESTPLPQALLMLHLSVFLYGLSVGAFGFLGHQYLERRYGIRNYVVTMPSLFPFSFRKTFLGMFLRDVIFYILLILLPMTSGLLLSIPFTHFRISSILLLFLAISITFFAGVSLSFFVSTLYMRSRAGFWISSGIVAALFGAFGVFNALPAYVIFPGLALQQTIPPLHSSLAPKAILYGLLGFGVSALLVVGALIVIPTHYEPSSPKVDDELPRLYARLKHFNRYRALLSKEFVDLKRSGTVMKMFFSFVAPLLVLSFTAWFVRNGIAVPVAFNVVFYGTMVGFFGVMLYNWLNNVDAVDYLSTLPLTVPQMIRTKLLTYFLIATWIGLAFVVGISVLNGDTRLLWLAIPVMLMTSAYSVVMTAYLTGLRTSSFLFDPVVMAQFSAMSILPELGLTILSFTIDKDVIFAALGIALVLVSLSVTTFILYRGIDLRWSGVEFTD